MRLWLSDGTSKVVCGDCAAERGRAGLVLTDDELAARLPEAEVRYCAGAYAGRYCDAHFARRYRTDLPNVLGGMTEDEIEAYDYRGEQ